MPLEDYRRYGRQMILKPIGLPGQLALRRARVLVVGAGGLGCPALLYLATAGIGHIGIVDHDTVELSNLHRQVLHTEASVELTKAESARRALLECAVAAHLLLTEQTQRLDQHRGPRLRVRRGPAARLRSRPRLHRQCAHATSDQCRLRRPRHHPRQRRGDTDRRSAERVEPAAGRRPSRPVLRLRLSAERRGRRGEPALRGRGRAGARDRRHRHLDGVRGDQSARRRSRFVSCCDVRLIAQIACPSLRSSTRSATRRSAR